MVIPTILLVSLLSFAFLYFAPGDAAELLLMEKSGTATLTDEDIQAFAQSKGLNTGFFSMYSTWFGGVLRGNLGTSYLDGRNINARIVFALGKTLLMSLIALGTYLVFGVVTGILSAVYRNGIVDRIAKYWTVLSTSIPVFWIGLFVVWLLSVKFGVLQTVGRRSNASLIVPGMLMGLVYAGNLIVIVREKALIILEEPFVMHARAMGAKRRAILMGHVLRNVLAPAIAAATLAFSGFISSGVLMENVFSLSGFGKLLMDAVNVKDYMVVASATLLLGVIVCISNMLADILYALIDRRETPNED